MYQFADRGTPWHLDGSLLQPLSLFTCFFDGHHPRAGVGHCCWNKRNCPPFVFRVETQTLIGQEKMVHGEGFGNKTKQNKTKQQKGAHASLEMRSACSPFHNIQKFCVCLSLGFSGSTVFAPENDSELHDPDRNQGWECADAIHRPHLGVIHTYIHTSRLPRLCSLPRLTSLAPLVHLRRILHRQR